MISTARINNLYDIIFGVMVFVVPISLAFPNIALILLCLLCVFKKGIITKNNFFYILLGFCAYLTLKALINNSFIENIGVYKNILFLAVISFLTLQIENKKRIKKFFVLGVCLSIIITLIKTVFYYNSHDSLPFGNHSDINSLLLIHRPYLGFMCFTAIVFIESFLNSKQDKIWICIQIILLFFIFLIVARLAMVLAVIFILIQIFRKIKKKQTKILLLVISSGFLLLMLFTNSNIKKRFHVEQKNNINQTINKIIDYEPRFVIWDCLLTLKGNSDFTLLFGFKNIKLLTKKLRNCYSSIEKESKRNYYLQTNFNTHNQYLNLFYHGGIIGLLLFILLLGFCYLNNEMYLYRFLFFGLLLFLTIENLLERQYGIYLLGILTAFYKHDKNSSYS